jgi:hypothetical protein
VPTRRPLFLKHELALSRHVYLKLGQANSLSCDTFGIIWPNSFGRLADLLSLRIACLPPRAAMRTVRNVRLHSVPRGAVHSSVPRCSRHNRSKSPRCRLLLPLRQGLRPSKGSIWPSSTHTHVCSDGLPPNLTCSDTSASARLPFTKWCSPSNERG